ncbi:MAG: sensor histidine kinase [Chloroflexi bacterium]|nr:sensor histidine kinase [Chloroflexota bacterium]
MDSANLNFDRKIVFPFYIFLTLLMGYMGTASVMSVWERGESAVIVSLIALFLLLIGLYWLNVLWVTRNDRWFLFYYPAQTALMFSIVWLLHGRSTVGLSFLFSATIAIVGEGLGVWGNTRRAFFIGIFYVGLLLGFLYLFSDRAVLLDSVTGLLVNGGSIILMMMMFNQLFVQRQKALELAESLESANAKLAAYNARIESLTLQNERQRMARELHDTLAQGVAGLVLQLEAVKAHLGANRTERAVAIVEQSIIRARSTLAESRAVIDDLRSTSTNIPDLIREKVERFNQATGIPCETEISVDENQLPPETVNHAMNILSESLTNIARHAQATKVKVDFIVQNQNLELEVRDNGKGFDVNQQTSGHYGLIGMHERARLIGGQVAIESNQNGTCVQFIVERS